MLNALADTVFPSKKTASVTPRHANTQTPLGPTSRDKVKIGCSTTCTPVDGDAAADGSVAESLWEVVSNITIKVELLDSRHNIDLESVAAQATTGSSGNTLPCPVTRKHGMELLAGESDSVPRPAVLLSGCDDDFKAALTSCPHICFRAKPCLSGPCRDDWRLLCEKLQRVEEENGLCALLAVMAGRIIDEHLEVILVPQSPDMLTWHAWLVQLPAYSWPQAERPGLSAPYVMQHLQQAPLYRPSAQRPRRNIKADGLGAPWEQAAMHNARDSKTGLLVFGDSVSLQQGLDASCFDPPFEYVRSCVESWGGQNEFKEVDWKEFRYYQCDCADESTCGGQLFRQALYDIREKGIQHQLEVFRTPDRRGLGLRNGGADAIPSEAIIMEYAGELIVDEVVHQEGEGGRRGKAKARTPNKAQDEVKKREEYYMQRGLHYLWDLKDRHHATSDKSVRIIDATYIGNAARFINHSCNPNLGSKNVCFPDRLDPDNRQLRTVALYAVRDIMPGEELTLNYHPEEIGKDKIRAGSVKCVCHPGCPNFIL